jgi:hypothetical protein
VLRLEPQALIKVKSPSAFASLSAAVLAGSAGGWQALQAWVETTATTAIAAPWQMKMKMMMKGRKGRKRRMVM